MLWGALLLGPMYAVPACHPCLFRPPALAGASMTLSRAHAVNMPLGSRALPLHQKLAAPHQDCHTTPSKLTHVFADLMPIDVSGRAQSADRTSSYRLTSKHPVPIAEQAELPGSATHLTIPASTQHCHTSRQLAGYCPARRIPLHYPASKFLPSPLADTPDTSTLPPPLRAKHIPFAAATTQPSRAGARPSCLQAARRASKTLTAPLRPRECTRALASTMLRCRQSMGAAALV